MNVEALVMAEMAGFEPMENVILPVGIMHDLGVGLQTPMVTGPPGPDGENGRFRSVVAGTVMVNAIVEEVKTVAETLASVCIVVEFWGTTPTTVFWVGSVLTTNPEPVKTG